jgi:hypothetical protein
VSRKIWQIWSPGPTPIALKFPPPISLTFPESGFQQKKSFSWITFQLEHPHPDKPNQKPFPKTADTPWGPSTLTNYKGKKQATG